MVFSQYRTLVFALSLIIGQVLSLFYRGELPVLIIFGAGSGLVGLCLTIKLNATQKKDQIVSDSCKGAGFLPASDLMPQKISNCSGGRDPSLFFWSLTAIYDRLISFSPKKMPRLPSSWTVKKIVPFLWLGYCGSLVGLLTMPIPKASANLSADRSYFGKVISSPRYRKIHGVEFSVVLHRELLKPGVEGDEDVQPKSSPPIGKKGGAVQGATTINWPVRVLCRAAYLPWRNSYHLKRGSSVLLRAKFRLINIAASPFSFEHHLLRDGYSHQCKLINITVSNPGKSFELTDFIRRRINEKLGDNEKTGLLLALTTGARDLISQDTENAFKMFGLSHLLVLSGYQVVLVSHALLILSRLLLRSSRQLVTRVRVDLIERAIAFTGALVLTALTGFEESASRALAGTSVVSLSQMTCRNSRPVEILGVTVLIISLIWPGCALSPGVQLTFIALFALHFGGEFFSAKVSGTKIVSWLTVTTLTTLATSIISYIWFGTFSLLAFVLNPILGTLVGPMICMVGLAALVLILLNIPGGESLGKLVCWEVELIRWVIIKISRN